LQKLLQTLDEYKADVAIAYDGERLHPVFLAINTSLKESLEDYLNNGQRKVEYWLKEQNWEIADFSKTPEIFTNINTLTELFELEAKYAD
jgi:molybdopterin-guanine dinucleotide biosynthesis protein A